MLIRRPLAYHELFQGVGECNKISEHQKILLDLETYSLAMVRVPKAPSDCCHAHYLPRVVPKQLCAYTLYILTYLFEFLTFTIFKNGCKKLTKLSQWIHYRVLSKYWVSTGLGQALVAFTDHLEKWYELTFKIQNSCWDL